MATLIDVGGSAGDHISECPARENTTIEPSTRYCQCVDGSTEPRDAFFEEPGYPWVAMRRVVRSCIHARATTHTCPSCGFQRTFGGPS